MQLQWRLYLPVALAIATLIGALTSSATWSQAGQTIRLILPFPPGGPADIIARLLAQQVGSAGGPTMVMESHHGAASRQPRRSLGARQRRNLVNSAAAIPAS